MASRNEETFGEESAPKLKLNPYVKRIFDISVATVGLVLYGPVFLIVSLAIAVEAPGPILIRETRYGYQGPIRVFKFRPDVADRNRNTYYTTVVAQILHSSGVGQLPQLLNVLCGEMSIVGPHPDNSAREHSLSILYDVKPGMTGLAQMSDNREELGSALQRIREDLRYVQNWTLFLDVKIVLTALFSRK